MWLCLKSYRSVWSKYKVKGYTVSTSLRKKPIESVFIKYMEFKNIFLYFSCSHFKYCLNILNVSNTYSLKYIKLLSILKEKKNKKGLAFGLGLPSASGSLSF